MHTEEHKLMSMLPKKNAPPHLYEQVTGQIETMRLRAARLHFGLSVTCGVLSGATLVPALTYTATEFSASSFANYASLLFSDGSSLLSYWQEFATALVESLPLFGITLSLFLALVFVNALHFTFKNSDAVLTHRFG